MTNAERVEAVRALGYTERQAGFLMLAAFMGGHFVRRQFNTYLGRECGALGQAFIERALEKGHATALRLCTPTIVYHLHARSLYAALGEEENRNRRKHAPATVKRRLMSLDFALELPGAQFFASQEERLDLLRSYGLEQCCIERHPIYMEPTGGKGVCFGYVDESARTLAGFWTFLEAHKNAILAVSRVQVSYVAGSRHKCGRAERLFERFVQQLAGAARGAKQSAIIEHFHARKRFEARDFSTFDQASLDRFRKERQVYSGEPYDRLYREWGTSGDEALLAANEFRPGEPGAVFKAYVLGENYDLFGGLTEEGES